MGSSPKVPKAKPTPPTPEAVRRAESDVAAVRSNAKAEAAGKYGISGTNVTRGALASEPVETKKKTLGGA